MFISFQINAQSYCTDGGPDLTADSNVESVDLVGENQSISYVGCQNGGSGVAGVEDLTSSQVADLIAGNTYTIDVQFGTCGGNFAGAGEVWIDFNQNLSFDASESIGTLASGIPPFSLSNFTFTVPSDAVNGTTRLRVIQQEGGNLPIDPCADFFWGSATDFGIDVSGGVDIDCQFPFNLSVSNITGTSADFSWDDVPNASAGYIYEIYNAGDIQGTDTPEATGTFAAGSTSGTVSGLSAVTDYDFYLISDCGATDGTSIANGPLSFTTLATCPEPTNITIDNVLGTSADISFTESIGATNGHLWELFAFGDDPATDTPLQTGSLPAGTSNVTISGLSSNTDYDFYLQADCGAQDGLSLLTGPITFTTPCDTFTAPYTNGFENFSIGGLSSDEDCWSENSQTGFVWEASDDDTGSFNTGPNQAFEGSNFVFTEASTGGQGDEAILLSPFIDLSTLTSPVINFYFHMHGGDMGTLHIDVDDGSGFTDDVFTISGQQQVNQDDAWLEQFVDLGAFAGETVQIRLRGERGDGFESDIAVDDFNVVEAPSCLKPTGVTLVNEFAESAEFSWDPITNATAGYLWEIYASGDDPTTDTPVSTGSVAAGVTQTIADGLNPETDYDFYVISDCGADGVSELSSGVAFTTTVLCPVPSNFETTNVLTTSVDLSWVAIPNDDNGYNWSIFNQGDDPVNDTPVASGNAPSGNSSVNVTGLTENTEYEAYIETDCGADGISVLSAPLAFTTPCTAFTAPVTENFDGSSWVSGNGFGNDNDAIDNCWARTPGNNGTNYFWGTRSGDTGSTGTGPTNDFSGNGKYVFTESSNGNQGDEAILETPLIDASALTTPQVRFYYHMFGGDMGTLHVDVNEGSGYNNDVFTISGQQQTTGDADWILVTVDLPNANVSNLRIRFRGERGGGFGSDMAIDQFSLVEAPTCPEPDNLAVSNITTTSADFTWDDETDATDGYDWFVFEAGDDPDNDTPVANGSVPAGTTSVNVTGLPSSSALQFYVQSNCGNGDLSLLTPALGFETLCDVFQTPYFENFANFSVSGDFIEDGCWEETSPGAFAWEVETGETVSTGTGPSGAEFGSNYLFTEASSGVLGDEAIVLTPEVDLSNLTNPSLSFWYHMFGADMGTLHIDVDDGTNLDLSVFSITGQQQTALADPFAQEFIDLSAYAGQTIEVRFRVERGDGFTSDVAIDGIRFDEAPTCFAPSNLTVDNVDINTTDLSWDDEPGATNGYLLEVYNQGDDPDVDTPVTTETATAGSTTATVTGLAPNTTYEGYIISDCGTDGTSFLSSPVTFTTLCDVFDAPYTNGFENFTIGEIGTDEDCWSEQSQTGYVWEASDNDTPSFDTGPNQAFEGSNFVFTEASTGSLGDEAILLSPQINLSTLTSPVINFYLHMYGGDMGTLHIDVDDGSGFTDDVFTISGQQQPNQADAWIEQFVDIGAFSGQTVQIRLRGERGDGFNSDIAVDDFRVIEAPSCLKPNGVTLINEFANSAEFSWNSITNATAGYLWEIYVAGDDPATDTPVSTGSVPAGTTQTIAGGLNPETDYDFYVISDCGAADGISDLSLPVAFTTTELCAIPNNFEANNAQPTSVDLSWTTIPNDNNGYNWSVFNQGDDPINDTPVASGNAPSGSSSVNVTGLTSNTAYDAYIETDCGTDGISDLSAPLPFTTPCTAVTAPVTENFDGTSWVSGTGFGNDNDAIDNCWNRNPDGTNGNYFWGTRTGDTGSGATGPNDDFNGGGNYVFTESSNGGLGDEALLESPLIDASGLNVPQVRFYYHMFGGDMGTLHVDVNDGTGYSLDEFTISGEQQTSGDEDWVLVEINLPNFNVSNLRVRFRGERGDGFGSDMAIDEFSLVEAPTCPQPTDVAVTNVTDETADVSWTAALMSQDTFDLEVVPAGTTPTGTPTEEDVTANPFTLTDLTSETEYDVYVRADCGGGDESFWVGPVSFATSITPVLVTQNNPSTGNVYCYGNSDFKEWLFIKDDDSNEDLKITFNGGLLETDPLSSDHLLCYDGPNDTAPILFDSDVDGNDLTGLTLTAPSGTIYMTLTSDIFGSCQGGTEDLEELDFDVYVGTLSSTTFESLNFDFYPNPVTDQLNLSAQSNMENVTIFNMIGQEVKSFNSVNNNSLEIPMSDLQAGAYFMKVSIEGVSNTFRVIKK